MTETLPAGPECNLNLPSALLHILGPPIEGGIFWDEYLSRASALMGCAKKVGE